MNEEYPEMKRVVIPEYVMEDEVVLDPTTTALLVIDMQNDFVNPKGKLFVPSARATVPAIRGLIERARMGGAAVIYTQDWHRPDDPEFKLWGEHAVAGTWGAEVVDGLKPEDGDHVIKKMTIDSFYGTSLDHILRLLGIRTLIITGTLANICVLHAAAGAAVRAYNVVYPIDAVSALNEFDYELAIRQIYFVYKGIITRSDHVKFSTGSS